MRTAAGDPVIDSLCLEQLAPWLGTTLHRPAVDEVLHALNASVRSIFLYRFQEGRVLLLEKPGFRLRESFNDSSEPEPEGLLIYREEFIRARMYRDFLERVVAGARQAFDMLIAVDVNDAPITHADVPVFAFQKPRHANTVLLPDIDFLHANFYIPDTYRDTRTYAEKTAWAVFAGSTTGGRTITAADVETLAIPRLRSGVFFTGSREVDFRLPRIVQCESGAVAMMVEALEVNRETCSWEQQFDYRFIISMDGNGATCSRVAIGLLSQSALIKYESPHLLYYFGALVAWRHFVPVSRDDEIPPLVQAERKYPGLFGHVAAEGREFARRYLGRSGTCNYTRELLYLYRTCVSGPVQAHAGTAAQDLDASLQPIECGAHIQDIGDVWGWPGEWVGERGSGRAIEAVAVVVSGLPGEAVGWRVVLEDGSLSDERLGDGFCGTRGQDRPLRGFEVILAEPWAARLECLYSGRFIDGETVGPLGSGEICRSSSNAALEAFRIVIQARPEASRPDDGAGPMIPQRTAS